jgi:hypothetical protein
MAVLGLNLAVAAMDQKLGSLVLRNFPRPVNGVRFSVKELRGAGGASALDGPSVMAGNHVLIAFRHVDLLWRSGIAAHLHVRESIETRTKC